ncbi:hypothetical protein PROFUN_08191 [Planoprotostelium fungivorum]|uniref:Uncharacterized protein n=1 Tax=Planoprotostelium fungivorum TaxID=1890364 RepID=A0A2P6N3U7_9EUKA|nr:hypothetical protein PROFUN_13503 [Planoprotostelium fungivorum]PRP79430.1 hypothetical protein PROFUN_08191 [Planoprotostelium fungivorum]
MTMIEESVPTTTMPHKECKKDKKKKEHKECKDKTEKRQRKSLKKDMKRQHKATKCGNKEEKRERKLQKKAWKKERKECSKVYYAKNTIDLANLRDVTSANPHKIIIDGSSLLSGDDYLSSLLAQRRMGEAEAQLNNISRQFAQNHNLAHVRILYDTTPVVEENERFSVASARPAFGSSVDAIVHQVRTEADLSRLVFVSNDKQLSHALAILGVQTVRSKAWFSAVNKTAFGVDAVNRLASQMGASLNIPTATETTSVVPTHATNTDITITSA